ncbi:unnamed protein product [Camellia sinensis]
MASNSRLFSVKIITLCFFTILPIFFLLSTVIAVPDQELESMLAVLRTRGYNLFCNALTTSDLYFDLLAGTSFTVFVPTDSSLFALDMTSSASVYIIALRYHIVPLRLSLADLRNLTSGSILPTLLPIHDIQVQRRPESENFTANGVDVVPGLFFGRNIAVHGLGGILSFRTQIGLGHGSSLPPPANLYNNQSSRPPVVEQRHDPPSEVLYPVPEPASFDPFSPADSPEIGDFEFDIWPASSTVPAIAPSREQATVSVPKDDDTPTYAPSPSIDETEEDSGEDWRLMLKSTAAIPWAFDTVAPLDCEGKESETLLGHVRVHPSSPRTCLRS